MRWIVLVAAAASLGASLVSIVLVSTPRPGVLLARLVQSTDFLNWQLGAIAAGVIALLALLLSPRPRRPWLVAAGIGPLLVSAAAIGGLLLVRLLTG